MRLVHTNSVSAVIVLFEELQALGYERPNFAMFLLVHNIIVLVQAYAFHKAIIFMWSYYVEKTC